jgi:steroid delta-isomerase-like uncharacterized protein
MPNNVQVSRGVFEELFNQGKLDFVDKNYDASFEGHETLVEDYDREELKKNAQGYRSAFPDLTIAVEETVEAGDKVLVRWSARGTHRGNFLGKSGTGKQMATQGLSVFTFRNGKIAEEWTQWDALGVVQDLGITPQIQQPGAPAAP